MPTTYTSSLGLALPATGENSGTWGDLVNNSITSLLDTAVAGQSNVSMTADTDKTLTSTAGAANESRGMFLAITSTVSLTATRNIIVPTATKLYYVYNNTTGSQSLTIKTAAGTGITVATQQIAVLWCDGTNVINAINRLNGTATTATNLSGTTVGSVPYQSASGTTGFSAAGTSGQPLVSGGTGSPTWGAGLNTTWPARARYFSSGTTYTKPSDVVRMRVFVFGATGGMASNTVNNPRGGCGGAGYSEKYYASGLASSYTYAIGAAGSTSGTAGGTTSFDVMSVTGSGGVTGLTGGSGGVGSGGDFNATGGAGGTAVGTGQFPGAGGGGGASRAGNGGNGGAGLATSFIGGAGGGGTGGNAGTAAGAGVAGKAGGAAATTLSATAITGVDTSSGWFSFYAGNNGGDSDGGTYSGDGGNGASGAEVFNQYQPGPFSISGSPGGLGGFSGAAHGTGSAGSSGGIVIWEYLQ